MSKESRPPYTVYTIPYSEMVKMPYGKYVQLPSQLPEQPTESQEDIEPDTDQQQNP